MKTLDISYAHNGTCRVQCARIIFAELEATLIVVTELAGNAGPSVTEAAPEVYYKAWLACGSPRPVFFIEHYATWPPTWEQVSFVGAGRGNPRVIAAGKGYPEGFRRPQYQPLSPLIIDALMAALFRLEEVGLNHAPPINPYALARTRQDELEKFIELLEGVELSAAE